MTDVRWKVAPPGSNWGEFGADDQLGRMNLVDRGKLLQGVAEVKEGLNFCLSLPLDYPGGQALNPRRLAPQRFSTLRDGKSADEITKALSTSPKHASVKNLALADVNDVAAYLATLK
jgi:hypothetical protein